MGEGSDSEMCGRTWIPWKVTSGVNHLSERKRADGNMNQYLFRVYAFCLYDYEAFCTAASTGRATRHEI